MDVSYAYLLNVPYQKSFMLTIILFLVVISLGYISLFYSYDSYQTYGVYDGSYLIVDVPIDNSDAVTEEYYIRYNDQKCFYEVVEVSEILNQNYINYQSYKIRSDFQNLKQNEVVEITFLYNKQRIIQKIINVIF